MTQNEGNTINSVEDVGVIKQTEDRRMGIQEGGNVGSVNAGGLETGGRHLIAG